MRSATKATVLAAVLAAALPARPAPPAEGPVLCRSGQKTRPPAWYDRAVFYEVFVRSFQDGDGDGIGDLPGLTSRLDYLNDGDPKTQSDLGVTGLWLMPVNPSPSYHGYDVTDYRSIEKAYGTLDDFAVLVRECDRRGIRIILDLVTNHTSNLHPWFVKGKRGKGQPYDDFYVWSDAALPWGKPWKQEDVGTWHEAGGRFYYGVFWSGMPDLNWKNPAVLAEQKDIATFWLGRGVAGFRLDAVRYLVENGKGAQQDLPETHAIWKKLRAHVDGVVPDALLVGEAWSDFDTATAYLGTGDELRMVFDFDRAGGLVDALRSGDAEALGKPLCRQLEDLGDRGSLGTFVTNHDMDRLATTLGEKSTPERLALAATLLLTLPGTPFLYYGEELGLANGPVQGDPGKRLPMRWDESRWFGFSTSHPWEKDEGSPKLPPVSAQANDPGSLLTHYKKLVHLRQSSAALTGGETLRLRPVAAGGGVLAYLRGAKDDSVLVVANLGHDEARQVTLNLAMAEAGLAGTKATVLLGGGTAPAPSHATDLGTLAPASARVIRFVR